MSNNYFNFNIPYFCNQFGQDWDAFQTIINEYVDFYINKTVQLYWLRDPSKSPIRAIEHALNLRGIENLTTDSVAVKKFKLRNFNPSFKNKGMLDLYLDIAENITGVRGTIEFYSEGYVFGEDYFPLLFGGGSSSIFNILINPKTTDDDELDTIQLLYQEKNIKPAFYKIYLVDDAKTTLRTI